MKDTICAVATAAGEGGIAIVRASGERAREIFEAAFHPARAKQIQSHRMMYGYAVDANDQPIDEAMGVFFAAPCTYTREDMFEIQCHGGSVCAQRVMKRLMALGARIAESGEFTRRAFLNGRIDLSRAEAVMALIGANSEAAARASVRELSGGISGFVRVSSDQLKEALSLIEASTDFPDEVEEADAAQIVRKTIEGVRGDIASRIDERSAHLLREGASIVLTGRPNVGKSSIMNALLNQDRAIVTSVPGTTRDVLTERIILNGVAAELSDTAGMRDAADEIERIGVNRAARAVENADIVLIVLDAGEELTEEDRKILDRRDDRAIVVLNKIDREPVLHIDGAICVSARTGEGMDDLVSAMAERVRIGGNEGAMTQQRHIALAKRAMAAIDGAMAAIDAHLALDVCAIDLKEALGALCEITGENATEAVIDRVFANFCVGK